MNRLGRYVQKMGFKNSVPGKIILIFPVEADSY